MNSLKKFRSRFWRAALMLLVCVATASTALAQSTGHKVTLKEGTTDATNWKAKAGESGDLKALPLEGVSENTAVTLQYSGRKRVKSVRATKKVPWDGDLSKLTGSEPEGYATATNGMTISGTLKDGVNVKVMIAAGATVTLSGATISGTSVNEDAYYHAGITCLGNATIVLSGTNSVKGFYNYYPGIHVPSGSTLTIRGDGSLDAKSNGYGCGIGGGVEFIACGNITIEGGSITATGGTFAAGIGGGNGQNNSCGDIRITGGTVIAKGGKNAAGIGSGAESSCGNISITGGTVEAYGGDGAVGIGSSDDGECGTITIANTVTKVTATMGTDAWNSIGAGKNGTCGTVTIGGKVYPNGITTSPFTYPTDLSTLTAAYTAQDGEMLTGELKEKVKISIAIGATVTLKGVTISGTNDNNCKWAGLTCLGNATIILSGDNTVKGFQQDYPGINVPISSTVTIKGDGSLTASPFDGGTYNSYGAGIGGGLHIACGNITIEGGSITATGGRSSAGIGGGYQAPCGNIRIMGGTVEATGGDYAAGIGGGYEASCGTVIITSDVTKVTATKGGSAPCSIGRGLGDTICDGVTIGGTVYWNNSSFENSGDTYLTQSPLVYEPSH